VAVPGHSYVRTATRFRQSRRRPALPHCCARRWAKAATAKIILGWTTGVKWRLNLAVIDISQFKNLRLQGGFIITDVELTADPIVDAIGREAIAQTQTIAGRFRLFIRSGLSEEELSITLYHEILEAASVAIDNPPVGVLDFNEADFERAAHDAHKRWGNASPANLDLLLQFHGFRGQ